MASIAKNTHMPLTELDSEGNEPLDGIIAWLLLAMMVVLLLSFVIFVFSLDPGAALHLH